MGTSPRQAKERQIGVSVNRKIVRSALDRERDDLVAVRRLGDSGPGAILRRRGRCLAQAEDVRPLLNFFLEVLVVEGVITE